MKEIDVIQSTNSETGWIVKAYIETKETTNISLEYCKCSKCNGKLWDRYLMIIRTNFKHRGNETDEVNVYHKKCTSKRYLRLWKN